jgi:hypothetical protein
MVDIDKYRRFVKFIANKNGKGAYESTDQFNLNAERAVYQFNMKMFGNPKHYSAGRPVPNVGYEASQKVIDDLRHLKVTLPFKVTDGLFNLPDGTTNDAVGMLAPAYLHLSRLYYYKVTQNGETASKTRIGIKMVKDSEIDAILESVIVYPDSDHPYGNIEGAGVRVYPETIDRVEMVYLRQPLAPVWGFTLVNNRELYDASTSTDLDIPEEAMNEVAMMHLSYIGIHIREQELIAYSEQQKIAGV